MKILKRYIVTFIGVYMEKSLTGTESRQYCVETRDHFSTNLELTKHWAEQNIQKFLPKSVAWLKTIAHVVPDDFALRRKGIKVPKDKLKKFLEQDYLKYRPLMLNGFVSGFNSEEERLKKQSKFYLDIFKEKFDIKPNCVEEYHIVFWNKLQNQIIRFLKHQDLLASHQANREMVLEDVEFRTAIG